MGLSSKKHTMALLDMLQKMATDLIVRIAEGEGLDADEMLKKYLGDEAKPTKKKTAPTRAAKVVVSDTAATKCTATTAKGKPCSLNALTGTCLCRVHTKKESEAPPPVPASDDEAAGPSTGPIKKPPPKKEKKKAAAKKKRDDPPVHTHELDAVVHEDCELCHTHGNPLAAAPTETSTEDEEEFETVTSPRRSLRSRLMAAAIEEENDYEEE